MASREQYYEDDAPDPERLQLGWIGFVVVVFAFLYAVTAAFFSTSDRSLSKSVRAADLYGPITVKRSNRVIRIAIKNSGPSEGWAFVEGEVLNAKKETVLSFGGNYWHESGYDDGYWSERKAQEDVVVRFPNPGTYFLKFKVEGGRKNERKGRDITASSVLTVGLDFRRGSSMLFSWLAGVLLFVAVVLNEIGNRSIRRFFKRMGRAAANAADEEDDE